MGTFTSSFYVVDNDYARWVTCDWFETGATIEVSTPAPYTTNQLGDFPKREES